MHNLCSHSCFSFPIKLNLYSEHTLNIIAGGCSCLTFTGVCEESCVRTALLQATMVYCFCQFLRKQYIFDNIGHFPPFDTKTLYKPSEFMLFLGLQKSLAKEKKL